MDQLRILVVDDHPLFRFGLCQTLQQVPDVEVAGEAATGTAAVAMADSLQPDVVVMDLNMPDFNGVEATRRIVRTSPHVGVLVLTMFDDNESVFAAMRAGARGYLLKGATPEEIVRAIRAVGQGQAIFGPAIASRLLGFFGNNARAAQVEAFPELTAREHEVLVLIAQGEGNAAIARKLVISGKTVRNHVSNIFSKLHVADRAEAIMRAKEAGLGEN
ncbi:MULTISPECIES: response regulator transcription factor [unclassified Crossiella]|uniref:response regulator n=1 Tax=unclassified Crossiella TaxID=2620835 RepID=UPI001FFF7FF5|nr:MULTISPECIES: response regulator transcription factor [unclassified Crossiella]MCK2244049.1 response regulator transcription factor [Crossiella sp. S99.2]MCK2257093.1 response regulator transcription factor [Crossiella sp. S99.1]